MIILPRQKTAIHVQLEVLTPRISPLDPLYDLLTENLRREQSGYKGEQSLDYYYRHIVKQPLFLHGLRIKDKKGSDFFQIDTLMIFSNFILIVEVKNYTGSLIYQVETGLLTRKRNNGELDRFDDPRAQVEMQRSRLQRYLDRSEIPIYTVVVFANQNCMLQINGTQPNFLLRERLPQHISQLLSNHSNTANYQAESLQLANQLRDSHQPSNATVVEKYRIHRKAIRNGVWCTSCKRVFMIRKQRSWHCPSCFHKDSDASIRALQEYKIIFGNEITNQLAREFLNLESRKTATRLLQKANFKVIGKNKGVKYILK
ncbi:nuclease-related domain-containing protein [Paraliobacillus sediminis]|uniref:nuclease-related domain-containing protein n=1 Tax=Paraliobacillus sediminis TaxID=1885916 RepID=UPI000E3DA135|nr:nuclease-related domain-containing protein [Paraliobacillus sediminis]